MVTQIFRGMFIITLSKVAHGQQRQQSHWWVIQFIFELQKLNTMTLIGDASSIILTAVVTFGFLWMFFPAWVVLVAERLEWEVERLSSPNTQSSELPILSLVIPAYNEQERIPVMIRESFDYLTSPSGKDLLRRLQICANLESELCNGTALNGQHYSDGPEPSIEWLIVNDGSNDSTCESVRETYKKLIDNTNRSSDDGNNTSSLSSALGWNWQIVTLKKNGGKGAAVKTGMNLAKGMFHLMVDADGATDFEKGLENLTQELEVRMKQFSFSAGNDDGNKKSGVDPMITVFGSRAHLEKESTAQRSLIRTLLMKAFHFFVSLFVSSKVHDTQCGFKIFTKSASQMVFKTLHLRRWAFDTEIVLLCDNQGIEIFEVAVPWKEVDGSKLSTSKLALAFVSISMLRDMICVRACYTLGIWRIKTG
jgi:dolichyl-phosphate beta-glucosyltransferase